jgi:hypothetical protein
MGCVRPRPRRLPLRRPRCKGNANDYNYPNDPVNANDLCGDLSADLADRLAKEHYVCSAGGTVVTCVSPAVVKQRVAAARKALAAAKAQAAINAKYDSKSMLSFTIETCLLVGDIPGWASTVMGNGGT